MKSLGAIAIVSEISGKYDAAVSASVPVVEVPTIPIFSVLCAKSHLIAFSIFSIG